MNVAELPKKIQNSYSFTHNTCSPSTASIQILKREITDFLHLPRRSNIIQKGILSKQNLHNFQKITKSQDHVLLPLIILLSSSS
jgi:hypothetical protein